MGALSERVELINRLQRAERRHAPRAHIRRDLIEATNRQLRAETRGYWTRGRAIVCSVLAVASIVYVSVLFALADVPHALHALTGALP